MDIIASRAVKSESGKIYPLRLYSPDVGVGVGVGKICRLRLRSPDLIASIIPKVKK